MLCCDASSAGLLAACTARILPGRTELLRVPAAAPAGTTAAGARTTACTTLYNTTTHSTSTLLHTCTIVYYYMHFVRIIESRTFSTEEDGRNPAGPRGLYSCTDHAPPGAADPRPAGATRSRSSVVPIDARRSSRCESRRRDAWTLDPSATSRQPCACAAPMRRTR